MFTFNGRQGGLNSLQHAVVSLIICELTRIDEDKPLISSVVFSTTANLVLIAITHKKSTFKNILAQFMIRKKKLFVGVVTSQVRVS